MLLLSPLRRGLSALTRARLNLSRRRMRFAGQVVLSEASGNDAIGDAICRGRPFMAGRLGFHELDAVVSARAIRVQREGSSLARWRSQIRAEPSQWSSELLRSLDHIAGFYPAEPATVQRLNDVLTDSVSQADLLAVWFRRYEDELMRELAPSALPILPRGLEPHYHEKPWTLALEGMKVLVVHPYADSIRAQFSRLDSVFAGKQVWPQCELVTLKAVQSIAGQRPAFADWFDALEFMQGEINKVNYDVAIIGAGAYGLPLAAHVKRQGRMAIHVGGATQLMFGIRGKRWDDRPEVCALYNDSWVRPAAHETPSAHKGVENGAYW